MNPIIPQRVASLIHVGVMKPIIPQGVASPFQFAEPITPKAISLFPSIHTRILCNNQPNDVHLQLRGTDYAQRPYRCSLLSILGSHEIDHTPEGCIAIPWLRYETDHTPRGCIAVPFRGNDYTTTGCIAALFSFLRLMPLQLTLLVALVLR
jgi:hypothetical protein